MSRMSRLLIVFLILCGAACAPAPRATAPQATVQTGRKALPSKTGPAAGAFAPASPAPSAPLLAPISPSSGQPPEETAAPRETAPPTGFGGLDWGVSFRDHPGLAVYEEDATHGITVCVWPQGPKDIYGAPVRDAFYEFHQGRFYHVWLNLDGMAAYKAALAGLIRAYGPPAQEVPEKYYHAWNVGDVNIYCAYHPAENEGDVSFFYQPIYERMMAARKAGQPPRRVAGSARP